MVGRPHKNDGEIGRSDKDKNNGLVYNGRSNKDGAALVRKYVDILKV